MPRPMGADGRPGTLNLLRTGLAKLFEGSNRGLLLDLTVFVLNLAAMGVLARLFVQVLHNATAGSKSAEWVLIAMAAALFVLAPIGAVLKRWHHHQQRASRTSLLDEEAMGSCLFNPIFYFCLTVLIFATVNAFFIQTVYGRQEPPGGVFIATIFGGIALMIFHVILVYRYFSPPKAPPKSAFLRSRTSAFLGDACLFVNMALFQLIWNLIGISPWPRPSGVFDFIFRCLLLAFLALLLYFPPRMFYLADDIGKRRTWALIFLANAPILVRVLIGAEAGVQW